MVNSAPLPAPEAVTVPTWVKLKVEDYIYVKEVFGEDSNTMLNIMRCESGFKQFDKNGETLKGVVHAKDSGIFQVNMAVWDEAVKLTGYDVYTFKGNTLMAKTILDVQGLSAWNASRPCWINGYSGG